MISEDVIQKVKDLNDIVDVISETVRLKKAGKYYTGLCPFHNEKTPSFTVTPSKQIFKCFGCGEAGNVISFVMKTKNVSFVEAVHILADRANIQIVESNEDKKIMDINQKLYKINVEAARYFFYNLKNNKTALKYLKDREITQKTINKFGLGYALDSWDGILNHLKQKGYSTLDILSAGLIVKGKNNSFYDRFRNRIIFPVFDYRGRVIGFGGRVLDNSKPKYLNSPETNIFKKGTNLYGINFAIKQNKIDSFIIVEGYMDCISLHQQGINCAVASLGTALTPMQSKLLKRYSNKVLVSYDADLAGQNATLRGLDILKEDGFDINVLSIPKGKDPDEFIRKNGKEAFLSLVNNSMELIDYKIQKAVEGIKLNNPSNKIKYATKALDVIKELKPIERDVYINKLSEKVDITEQALYDLMNNKLQKFEDNNTNMNIENIFGNKLYLEPPYIKAERGIIKLSIGNNNIQEYILKNMEMDEFNLDEHKKIFELIVHNSDKNKDFIGNLIEVKFKDANLIKQWINIVEFKIVNSECDFKVLIDDFIKEIRKHKLELKRKDIMKKIKEYERNGHINESLKLAQELISIQKQLGKIQ